jgi:branched-chain amino acid transport system permease protein
VIGGFLIGIVETFMVAFGYSTYSDAFTFLLLILILLFRPTGLMGESLTEKV